MISTLIPSYGRDYKSKKLLLEDFNANKDFTESISGKQINSSEILKAGYKSVNVRYKKLTQIAVLNFNETKQIWV